MNLVAVYILLQSYFLKSSLVCRIYHNRDRKSGLRLMPATLNKAKKEKIVLNLIEVCCVSYFITHVYFCTYY